MKFSFTEEQDEFRSVLRRFLEDKSPSTEVRRLMATSEGWEREQWSKINTDLGLTAVAIPEEYGGHGFGLSEQCIVLEEMGRSLLCAPYFGSAVLAASAMALRPATRVARAPTKQNLFGGAPPEEDTPASPPPGQGGGQTMSVPGLGDDLCGNQSSGAPSTPLFTRLTG